MLRFELPAEKKLVHEMSIPVRWGDMDAMGHVNNTIYFRYAEILRLDWFFKLSGSYALGPEGVIVVNAFCNFIKQVQYPGDLLGRLYACNPGRTSFDTFFTLEREDEPGVVYCEGGAKTVWANYPQKRALPLPDWLRQVVA